MNILKKTGLVFLYVFYILLLPACGWGFVCSILPMAYPVVVRLIICTCLACIPSWLHFGVGRWMTEQCLLSNTFVRIMNHIRNALIIILLIVMECFVVSLIPVIFALLCILPQFIFSKRAKV